MAGLKKDEEYLVYYTDDTDRPRKKNLLYLGREGPVFVFLNPRTKKKEVIPSGSITRWESTKMEEME